MKRHSYHNDEIDRAFDALLERAFSDYVKKQEELAKALHKHWHYDLNTGVFKSYNSWLGKRHYSFTVIATYLPSESNWCWGWANDGLPEHVREQSSRIKKLTEKTQYNVFVDPHFNIEGQEIDELCALALHELGGIGVFKVKDKEPWVFLALH